MDSYFRAMQLTLVVFLAIFVLWNRIQRMSSNIEMGLPPRNCVVTTFTSYAGLMDSFVPCANAGRHGK